ncbi:sodium/nucleoside cotransporter 1-like [Dermacentor andersoni]|uniref:sodium/nucleoside cotransporter 1-like n=1 Tax=Dermacentor andersoni TaxID=34620 RepID=UPI0024177B54|nr:sodium/nucleoside cotransporter 1-like [Dermacentor andersoni]
MLLHMLCVKGNILGRIVDGVKDLKIRSPRLKLLQKASWILVMIAVAAYVLFDSSHSIPRLTACGGVGLCILIGYGCSKNRKEVPWPSVVGALIAQFLCGLLMVRWTPRFFQCLIIRAGNAINSTFRGSAFIFAYLDDGHYKGLPRQAPIFAFHILPVLLFFSFLLSVLHYCGAVQFVAVNMGIVLRMITRLSTPECISSSATILVGLPMAVAFIKPFMSEMTLSELHCIMVAGYCGQPAATFAMILNVWNAAHRNGHHLLAANLMSVPAGLGMAKLLLPETQKAPLASADAKPLVSSENTVFEAGSNGVIGALPQVAHIMVALIVYTAVLHMADAVLGSMLLALGFAVRLKELLGILFSPLSFAFGLTGRDAVQVGYLLAVHTIGSEVLAFIELNKMNAAGAISKRAGVLSTYALSSSSCLGQVPAVTSVLNDMAPPSRIADIQSVCWRALFTGCLSTLLNTCIAGCLVTD